MDLKIRYVLILIFAANLMVTGQYKCPLVYKTNKYVYNCIYKMINKPEKYLISPINTSYKNVTVEFYSSYIPIYQNTTMVLAKNFDLISLKIDRCKLETIASKTFEIYPRLYDLHIVNNNISDISASMFENLNNLITLNLTNNNITTIAAKSFSDLSALRTIDLSENNLKQVENTFFYSAHFIQYMNFSRNQINNIQVNAFDNSLYLINLDLSSNLIKELNPSFKYLHLLQNLSLANNFITNLKPNIFKGLNSLNNLDLSGNDCSNILWSIFTDTPKIQFIDITSNKFNNINVDEMQNIKTLKNVSISKNNYNCDDLAEIVAKLKYSDIVINLGYELDSVNINGIKCYFQNDSTIKNSSDVLSEEIFKESFAGLEGRFEMLSDKIFLYVLFIVVLLIFFLACYVLSSCIFARTGKHIINRNRNIKELEPIM